MSWVFEHSRSKKNARLVLLAIADCANDEGRQAYPSMPTLMKKTGLCERAVTGLVGDLERLGELEVKRNGGPRGCNLYRVVMTPAESAPPQNLHPAGSAGVGKKKPQAKRRTPAESAPPANPAPPQETTATPAESAPGTVLDPPETSSTKKSSSERAKPKRRIPDDFTVTPAMIAWAREHTPLVGAAETAQFIDWHKGKGTTMSDWVAAWRTWMRKSQTDAERYVSRASPRPQHVERNGMKLKPETAQRFDDRERFKAMDEAMAANGTLAIGGTI